MSGEAPTKSTFQVLLFYKYVDVAEPHKLSERMRALAERFFLTGRVILAHEGINATLEGSTEDTERFVQEFLTDVRFSDVKVKKSVGTGKSFPGLSVKVRKEIVGTGFSDTEANPRVSTAPGISAEELRQWFESGRDFTVIDMRNDFEYASGHFKNSVAPGISASRHLPLVIEKLTPLKNREVVTVCTGGIRCEKMAAYLMHKGFTNVRQLDGGIHTYIQKYPGEDFLGTLYTFDQRFTMDFGGGKKGRVVIGSCRLCGGKSEEYADCEEVSCHLHFIVCTNCRDDRGRAYCSAECRVQNKSLLARRSA